MITLENLANTILSGKRISTGANGDFIKFTLPNGETLDFEIYAGINYLNTHYLIVHPVLPIDGVEEDEGLVFKRNRVMLTKYTLETDEEIIQAVFEEYYKMIGE